MFLLLKIGSIIGALPTIAMVVLTATVGFALLKREGIATLQQVQVKLAAGQIPGQELLEGIMLLIGGALLLTPGFVTDTFGFLCLIPIFRKPIAHWLIRKGLMKHMNVGGSFSVGGSAGANFNSFQTPPNSPFGNNTQGDIIEGEFKQDTEINPTKSIDTSSAENKDN